MCGIQADSRKREDGLSVERLPKMLPKILWRILGKIPRNLIRSFRNQLATIDEEFTYEELSGKFYFDDDAVVDGDLRCSCPKYLSFLYPCGHLLKLMKDKEIVLTSAHMHNRWLLPERLLSMEVGHMLLEEDSPTSTIVEEERTPPILFLGDDLERQFDRLRAAFNGGDGWFQIRCLNELTSATFNNLKSFSPSLPLNRQEQQEQHEQHDQQEQQNRQDSLELSNSGCPLSELSGSIILRQKFRKNRLRSKNRRVKSLVEIEERK
jgi:hypothetical protein